MFPGLKLDLADGQRWLIRPLDNRAGEVVNALGRVMRLEPGDRGRELYVAVPGRRDWYEPSGLWSDGPVTCCLADPADPGWLVMGMDRVASLVALDSLARGGLLLHAALAEFRGGGVLLAGPGTVGKSTASRRLPPPWRSLCDDTALVVRDRAGGFWAHPWPTWSRLRADAGDPGTWAVEQAVPLRLVCYLSQAPVDRLEPTNATQATALALESAIDFSRHASLLTDTRAARQLCLDGYRAARTLADRVPAFSLALSLDGRFWEEIERVLPAADRPAPQPRPAESAPVASPRADDRLLVVYAGRSMEPTLVEPELLEVAAGPVRPGDVACFRQPGTEMTAVHRVTAVTADGARTRGDNCAEEDAWVVPAGDIIGRVTAARRGARRRRIPGGRAGLARARNLRLGRAARRWAGLVPHRAYLLLARLGLLRRLLPGGLRPRLVRFDARGRRFLKLLMAGRMVGRFDRRRGDWVIRRPFRLFTDERLLAEAAARFRAEEARG